MSGLVLGAVSVAIGVRSDAPAPEAAALDVPAGSEFNQSRDDTAARLPGADARPQGAEAPQVNRPEADDLTSLEGTDTQPAGRPQTGAAEGDLSAPQVAPETGTMGTADTDAPVQTAPQSGAPEMPGEEADLSISTDPAQPAQPQVEEEGAVFARPPEDAEQAGTDQAGSTGVAEDAAPLTDSAAEADDATETAPADSATDDAPSDSAPSDSTPADSASAGVAADDAAADTAPDAAPSGTIGNLAEGVATNRLPAITDAPQDAQEAAPTPAMPDEGRAIERHAMPFDNPEGKPLMSIVLIDDGSSPIGLQALADFPYPLSFAIDAGWSGATEAARRYRDAGFEVLAMADLPEGARPADTEIAMQTVLDAVPGAVAIMEGTGTGLQSSRQAAEQLAPILLEGGQGLVMFSKGLDTAQKLIAREGVPSLTVFRDFDANDQSATVIRRFLDQAAFKATRNEGGVIMVGRLRADTITALLLWGLQDRANRVALAPVSAVLLQEN